MSGVGITYIWASNGFPSFVRLEGKRGDCETYYPLQLCRIVTAWKDSDFVDDVNYKCSECGGYIPVYERNPDDYFEIISAANYCPNCGAKVVDE